MRKIILILFIGTISLTKLNAQESKGKLAFDFNFDPAAIFDASAGSMFEMPYIKGRYFIMSDLSLRVGIGLGFGGDKNYPNPLTEDYTKTSSSLFSIAPGIEKHFGGDKFTVYVGGEIPFTTYSTKIETKVGTTTTESVNINGGYLGFGFNIVTGFDFYVFENLYVGAEFAPGFLYNKDKEVTVAGTVTQKASTNYDFGLNATSGIRIGVRF